MGTYQTFDGTFSNKVGMLPCILDGADRPLLIKLRGPEDAEAPAIELAIERTELGVLAGSVHKEEGGIEDKGEWKIKE